MKASLSLSLALSLLPLRIAPAPAGTQPLGTLFCFGDGSGAPCPCGNESAVGAEEGCARNDGHGARLRACGSASLSADDAIFSITQLENNQPALLFAARNRVQGGAGVPFGDGLRCIGGDMRRLRLIGYGGTEATCGPGLLAGLNALPGETWRFQVWYRSVQQTVCLNAFNFTNGLEFTLAP